MGRIGKKKRTKAFKKAWLQGVDFSVPSVFDNIKRTDDSPKRNSEPDFKFYNRSPRGEIGKIRKVIEGAVEYYPRSEVNELVSRIRSGDGVHFRSAIFELFIHEALRRRGFDVTVHPELANGSQHRPDFLVSSPGGESFYLEAVLATEKSQIDNAGQARKNVVLDVLNRFPHDNFMIAIADEGSPKNSPSGKRLKNEIHFWLNALDPDEVYQIVGRSGLDSIEPQCWSLDGWSLQIRPLPLKPEQRGKSSGLIGIGYAGGGVVDAWSPIRDAVKFKGGKYGELDRALVVAVNLDSFHLDRIDEMQALFGQEVIVFDRDGDANPQIKREQNGAWYGKGGPQYTRVSAAWIFNDLQASSLAKRRGTVYINPWALLPIPDAMKCFPYAEPRDGKMEWFEGVSFREIFEIDEEWPE